MEKQITNVDIGLWCSFIIVLLQSLSNNKKPGKAVSNLTSVELYTENIFKFIVRKIRCCISIRMLKMHIFF